jgi:hypothetical protein
MPVGHCGHLRAPAYVPSSVGSEHRAHVQSKNLLSFRWSLLFSVPWTHKAFCNRRRIPPVPKKKTTSWNRMVGVDVQRLIFPCVLHFYNCCYMPTSMKQRPIDGFIICCSSPSGSATSQLISNTSLREIVVRMGCGWKWLKISFNGKVSTGGVEPSTYATRELDN